MIALYGAEPEGVSGPSVGMAVVGVAHVRVRMRELLVTVHVGVRLRRQSVGVRVLMVVVVHVPVVVDDDLVAMQVVVALPEQEGDAGRHQRTGNQFADADGLGQHQWRDERTDERGHREHRGLARRAQDAQRVRVEEDADPVAHRTERQRG